VAASKFTLDIFIHMDAVGRNEWSGAPDDRPLTEAGKAQSARIAEVLRGDRLDGLYSSPATRCRESLEPLAEWTGLPVVVMPGFRDTLGYKAPSGWENPDRPGGDPLGGALSAGSAYAALKQVQSELSEDGRAVLCSYGDIVPALLAFLAGAHGIEMPARNNKKGAIYTVTIDGDSASLSLAAPPEGFPG
jgi:8-oxo-dGTP diphosphatase